MAVLLDSNVLLRVAQPHAAQAAIAKSAIGALRARGEELQIAAQNLVEFWAVATRPVADNGLGFSIEQAGNEVASLKGLFVLLPEAPIQSQWERLVKQYRVSGKATHDAHLVAAMLAHGTQSILTFNAADFKRYGEITVLDPRMVG